MAFLVPLLLPHIVEAGANIGIGISNAIQGDSSSVSFQIGGKVFTSRKSFNFGSLPPELRIRIILEALDASKSYIQPAPFIMDPMAARMYEIQRQIPLNSSSENFRSIYGDRVSANGYPISSWRWQYVASEWREVLGPRMWRDMEVIGFRPWANLIDQLEGKKPPEFLRQVKTITLKEGFQTPSDLYAVLSCPQLDNLESISILPDYPTPYHPLVSPIPTFTFGFQLIRTKKNRLSSLTYGLPLETSTNEASRQQLGVLQPSHLNLTFVRPTLTLFKELSDIVGKTTDVLDIRYIPNTTITSHTIFLCDPLQEFKKVNLLLYLPRPRLDLAAIGLGTPNAPREDSPPIATFLASLLSALEAQDKEVQKRYTITRVDNWDIPGMAEKATRTKLWPAEVLFDEDDEDEDVFAVVEGKGKGREVAVQKALVPVQPPPPREGKHWERETNLRLLGGLVNLRLESKKH